MTYETITQAKLAERYGVTAPFMRKALIDKGLVHPENKRPTRIGHLAGGASFVERSVNDVPARWAVWHIETIDAMFPELAANMDTPATVFPDRFKAASALEIAGTAICACFTQKQISEDDDLHWLSHWPGHGSLMTMDEPKRRREWCREFLEPLRKRIGEKIRRSRSKSKPEAIVGLNRIDGVITWLSRRKSPPPSIGEKQPEHMLSITESTPTESGSSIMVCDEDMKVLLAGWVFDEGGDTDDETIAYETITTALYEAFATRMPPGTAGERLCLTKAGTEVHLLAMHLLKTDGEWDWAGTAWRVSIHPGRIDIEHRTSMTVRLPIIDGRCVIEDLEGEAELADRAFGLVPRGNK